MTARSSVQRWKPLLLFACLALTAQRRVDDSGRESEWEVDAYAVVGTQLLKGRAETPTDFSVRGKVRLVSVGEPRLTCSGYLLRHDRLELKCDNGFVVEADAGMDTNSSGWASRRSKSGLFTFAYGVKPRAARKWLEAPKGWVLRDAADDLVLEPAPAKP